MSNRAYLVGTDKDQLYPSKTDPDFSAQHQTIAQGIYCVPLLWWALFRPPDWREEIVRMDWRKVAVIAPLVDSKTALEQLESARPILDRMFGTEGSLSEYVPMLHGAILSLRKRFLTMELLEIAHMAEPQTFYNHARYATGSLAGTFPEPVGRNSLISLSEITPHRPFPSANCLIDRCATVGESRDHAKILGVSFSRPAPWDPVEPLRSASRPDNQFVKSIDASLTALMKVQ